MKNTPDKTTPDDHLRQHAEELIKNRITDADPLLTEADPIKLNHEIEVQHIELEMQNEEIIESQLAAQRAIDLYDFAPTGYFSLTRAGKIIRLNMIGAQLLNKDRDILKEGLFGFFVSDDTRPIFNHFLEQVFQTKNSKSCEICISSAENNTHYVFLTGTLDKEEELCLVTAVDITVRKKNEENLQYERGLYQDIVNNQPAGIYRIRVYQPEKWWDHPWSSSENPPYRMELASDRFCEILGITREDFEKKPAIIIDLIHPNDKQDFILKNEEANNNVIPFKWDGRLVVNGKITWIHLESIPRVINTGEILWTGILFDDTDRKEKEAALVESENRYRELVDNSPDAISIYRDGKIVFINNECLRLMGASSADELLGKQVIEFVDPDYRSFAAERMRNVITDGKILPLADEKFIKLDGSPIDVEVKSMPIVYQNKPAVQLIVRDITERKKTQQLLLQSEDRFQQLFNKAPLGYQALDIDGHFIEVNQQWLDTLGFNRDEVIGKWFGDFLAPEYKEAFRQRFPLFKAQGYIHSEFEMVHKNGTRLFIAFDGRVGYDSNGNFKQTHCILQDVTDRKRTEKALMDSEIKFRSIAEQTSDLISITDTKGTILYASPASKMIFGVEPAEMEGSNFIDYLDESSVEKAFNTFRTNLISGERAIELELTMKRKDGTLFMGELNGKNYESESQKGTIVIIRDVTERKNTENDIRKSREDFKDLFDNAPVGYHEIDAKGRIVRINQTELTMLGYTSEELTGQFIWRISANEWESCKAVNEKLKGRSVSLKSFGREFKRKDGTTFPVLIQDNLLRDSNGKITGIRSTIQDITERKASEKEIQKSREDFKDLFDNAPVGYHEIDAEGRIVRMNQTELSLLGYSSEELLGRYIWELNSDIQFSKESTEEKLKGLNFCSSAYERELVKKDGTKIITLVLDSILRTKDGTITGIRSSVQDISERKQAELDLQLSEEKFRNIFEKSSVGKSMTTINGEMTVNKAFTEIIGYSEEELSALTWKEITHKDDIDYNIKELDSLISGEKPFSRWEKRYIHKNGNIVWVDLSTFLFRDSNGKPLYFITEIYDITTRKKSEADLRNSEEKFKKAFMTSPDSVNINRLDDGLYLSINTGFTRIMGYTEEDVIGKKSSEITIWANPEDRGKLAKELQEKGFVENLVTQFRHKSGELVYGMMSASLIELDGIEYILNLTRDITELRKTEMSLQQSEELYRNLVLQIPDGVYKSTPEGKFIDVNPAMVKMLGYENKEELLAIDIKSQLYFDEAHRKSAILEEMNKEMGIFPLRKKDGSAIWIEDHGWYNTDINGEVISHEGVLRDITERKLAQDALQEREVVLKKTLTESTGLIDSTSESIDYEKISNTILELSGAKYCVLNIFDENGLDFTTVAFSGVKEHILKASSYVGFEIINKKWKYDPERERKTENNSITRFDSLHELSNFLLPKTVSSLLEKMFNVGELNVVKISKNNKPIGDFTLIYAKGETLRNNELVLLFANQVALYIDRDKADKELRVNEEKYRHLFDNNPQPMWIYDLETLAFLEVNKAAIQHYGYSREEFMSMTLKDIRPKEDIPILLEAIDLIRKGSDSNKEWRHTKKNGEIIYVEMASVSVITNGRKARHLMINDITERKRAEEALRNSEEKFRSITEQIEDLIIINDTEGFIKYASPASREFFQCEPEELNNHHFTELIHEDSLQIAMEVFRAGVKDRKKAVDIELKMKRKDGSVFYAELNGTEFNNGEQKGILTVLHDITSRKQTVEQLRESEEKFRSITEQTSDLISISDINGKIIYASTAAKSIFQFEPDEMCGHNFIEFIDDDSKESALNELKKGQESNIRMYNMEFKMKRKDGSVFYGELNGSSFMYGNKFGFLVVIRDVSERKKAQDDLEEKMNELVRFHNLTVDREMTMIELKNEVNRLLIESGKEKKYKIVN